jgi:hypothetical protein
VKTFFVAATAAVVLGLGFAPQKASAGWEYHTARRWDPCTCSYVCVQERCWVPDTCDRFQTYTPGFVSGGFRSDYRYDYGYRSSYRFDDYGYRNGRYCDRDDARFGVNVYFGRPFRR